MDTPETRLPARDRLRRALRRGESLDGADLRACDLRDMDLRAARSLRRTDLRGADLQRARLDDVNLHGARLDGADLRGASLVGTRLPSRCADVRLDGADVTWARPLDGLGAPWFLDALHDIEVVSKAHIQLADWLAGRGCKRWPGALAPYGVVLWHLGPFLPFSPGCVWVAYRGCRVGLLLGWEMPVVALPTDHLPASTRRLQVVIALETIASAADGLETVEIVRQARGMHAEA